MLIGIFTEFNKMERFSYKGGCDLQASKHLKED